MSYLYLQYFTIGMDMEKYWLCKNIDVWLDDLQSYIK